ncbi:F-box associated domain-containing protein [Caenorhabditis elegans]|uniref:F-box associated domain-containing protein n=1 Tax=Caenorhabditis elegans TaxID=6239 RepID=A0A5S9MMF1_CAEEL|nr:F-box associated domain-containing protein [Caenorhabditis elegans]CAA0059150.1 F-box associated domain-containing protein [Caenorhabditis elegans]
MTGSFPILRLPNKTIQDVLQNMSVFNWDLQSCDSVTVPKTMLENCINNDQHKKITYFSLFPERHLMPNHKIHCLNLGSVSYELPGRGKNLQLDDVLLMNCSKLCLFPCKLSSQELNIFIRLYIAQPNRQLETVELHRTNEGIWKVEDSMKGISYSIWNKNPGNNHKLEKRIKFTQNDETMMHLDWKLDSIRCSTVITIE